MGWGGWCRDNPCIQGSVLLVVPMPGVLQLGFVTKEYQGYEQHRGSNWAGGAG